MRSATTVQARTHTTPGAAVAEKEVLDAGGSGSTSINNDQNSIISEAPIKRKRKKKQVNH